MRLHQRLRSLRDLSISNVSELVQSICLEVHFKYEQSTERERLAVAEKLQEYLVVNIRPVLDEVCTYTFSLGRTIALEYAEDIVLATFMHSAMKTLLYSNHHSLDWQQELWEKYLKKVPNLVSLDLGGIGNRIDCLLEVIANNCPNLEYICLYGGLLSEKGIKRLAVAKNLRVIKNRDPDLACLTETCTDARCVTVLLRELPRLEYVHCSCMGKVLEGWTGKTPLALTHCWERAPNEKRMSAVAKLCPDLRHLRLGHSSISNDLFDFPSLVHGSLELSSVNLSSFKCSTRFNQFLVNKGMFITSLEMSKVEQMHVGHIIAIGMHCKNIRVLKIQLQNHWGFFPNARRQVTQDDEGERIFENLETFRLEVNGHWALMDGLLCLSRSKGIRAIEFGTMSWLEAPDRSGLENVLTDLLARNEMSELRTVTLKGPWTLSPSLVQRFHDLPALVVMKFELEVVFNADEYL